MVTCVSGYTSLLYAHFKAWYASLAGQAASLQDTLSYPRRGAEPPGAHCAEGYDIPMPLKAAFMWAVCWRPGSSAVLHPSLNPACQVLRLKSATWSSGDGHGHQERRACLTEEWEGVYKTTLGQAAFFRRSAQCCWRVLGLLYM